MSYSFHAGIFAIFGSGLRKGPVRHTPLRGVCDVFGFIPPVWMPS